MSIQQPEETPPPVPESRSRVIYILIVAGMSILTVVCVTAIEVARPNQDNSDAIQLVLSITAPVTAMLVGFIKMSGDVREVHYLINSRMEELLRVTGIAAHKQGIEDERAASKLEAKDVAAQDVRDDAQQDALIEERIEARDAAREEGHAAGVEEVEARDRRTR